MNCFQVQIYSQIYVSSPIPKIAKRLYKEKWEIDKIIKDRRVYKSVELNTAIIY